MIWTRTTHVIKNIGLMMERPLKSTKKATTLKDVARAAGVSTAAISYALNGGGTLSAENRKYLQDFAKEMGYRPNRSAQAVRTGVSKSLGLIVPDLRNPYFPELAQSIEKAARERGYFVVLIDTQNSEGGEAESLQFLAENGVDGIIWCTTASEQRITEKAVTPTILLGLSDGIHDSVRSDDQLGGELTAEYLLGRGHREIGIISSADIDPALNERSIGLRNGFEKKGKISWEVFSPRGDLKLDSSIARYLKSDNYSAIVCGNDVIAINTINALKKIGRHVPDDIAVVGFDDIPWCDVVWPSLTTIRQPFTRMGDAAVKLMLERLAEPDSELRDLILPVTLVERESA